MSLYEDISQHSRYAFVQEEAVVALLYTHTVVMSDFDSFVRQYGLTPVQYNILRILRGAQRRGEALGRNELKRRMVDRIAPDVTRLLQRLERAGLVERDRSRRRGEDQRFIPTTITQAGLDLLAEIDRPLIERHVASYSQLSEEEIQTLILLLEKVRTGVKQLPPVPEHGVQDSAETAARRG